MNKAKIYHWVFAVVIIICFACVASADEEYEKLWSRYTNEANIASISQDGNYVVVSGQGKARFYNREGELLWDKYLDGDLSGYRVSCDEVAISSDGNYIKVDYTRSGKIFYLNTYGEFINKPDGDWYNKKITPDDNYKVEMGGLWGAHVSLYAKTSIVASERISQAESTISQAKARRFIVTEAENLLMQSKTAFSGEEYSSAKSLADQAIAKVEEISKLATPANDAVEDTKSAIHAEKSKGFHSAEAESLLSQAEQTFKAGNYEEAKSLAENATALALDIDQDGASNEEDFAPTIKNLYIYTGTPLALLVLAALTKVSLDVRKRRKIKRLEKQKIRREEEGRRLEYERRIRELKAKYEQYKREGYAPNKDLEEMLK